MFMYFVHLFVTDIFFISMAAKDMYSVWFHWTPSLDLSSARVFQVWMSRSHDQGLHRTIFFKMAPLFSMWHARTQQKGNGFLCKCIWNCLFFLAERRFIKYDNFFLIDIIENSQGEADNNQNKFVSLPYQILTINFIIIKILQFHCRLAQSNGDSII